MFGLDEDTTLVAAHTAAVMGGWIPESWVARFVGRQLSSVLRNLESVAERVHERYTAGYPIFTGSGERITPAMAVQERDRYAARQGDGLDMERYPRKLRLQNNAFALGA